jgi:hypothetical protein
MIQFDFHAASSPQRVHLSLLSPRTQRTLLVCFLFLNDGKMSILFLFIDSSSRRFAVSLSLIRCKVSAEKRNLCLHFGGDFHEKKATKAGFAHAPNQGHRLSDAIAFSVFRVRESNDNFLLIA